MSLENHEFIERNRKNFSGKKWDCVRRQTATTKVQQFKTKVAPKEPAETSFVKDQNEEDTSEEDDDSNISSE